MNDERLREHGFEIADRPEDGAPTWRSIDGTEMNETDALLLIEGASVESLQFLSRVRKWRTERNKTRR